MNAATQNIAMTILSMAAFALATSASPGPVNIICAMSGARYGSFLSLRYIFGATLGFVTLLLLAGMGLATIVGANPIISNVLTVIGSVYMLYLAFRIACSDGDIDSGHIDHVPGFLAGALAQWTNPKAWIVSVSGISIYVATKGPYVAWLITFATLFLFICAASLWMWTMVGHRLARHAVSVRTLNRIMAGLLAVSVAMLLLEVSTH